MLVQMQAVGVAAYVMQYVPVTLHYAFRLPGGTRGVQNISQRLGRYVYARTRFRQFLIEIIHVDNRKSLLGQAASESKSSVLSQHRTDLCVVQDVRQSFGR